MKSNIDHKTLLETIKYDSKSGIFTWYNSRPRGRMLGQIAGAYEPRGYLQIRILGKLYRGHRLAWFYTHGVWADQIDHIDRDKRNNSISNLRDVTNQENHKNMPLRSNSTTGANGVSKSGKRFRAYITISGKNKHIGVYDTIDEAKSAQRKRAEKLGFHSTHGE